MDYDRNVDPVEIAVRSGIIIRTSKLLARRRPRRHIVFTIAILWQRLLQCAHGDWKILKR